MSELPAEAERIEDLLRGGLKMIRQPAATAFGIDSVLLADFVCPRPGDLVIDLGCGSGVIALLLAVKQPDCRLTGLELMEAMVDLARRNVALNNLGSRMDIVHGDIAEATELLGRAVADLIVVNPPYYKPGEGRECADLLRAAARSERFCPLPVLLAQAAALLKPLGRCALVHRAERLSELIVEGEKAGLHAEALRLVQPRAAVAPNLLLLEYRKASQGKLRIEPPLCVYDQGQEFSREMQAIYAGRPGGERI